jgi:O-antigen/teichoic acid export membrane protein
MLKPTWTAFVSNQTTGRVAFFSVLARGVVSQAILSAANFAVSLILLRYGPSPQYGYYVLAFNAVTLLTALQGAFIGPPMVNELARLDGSDHGDLISNLYRGQRQLLRVLASALLAAVGILWLLHVLDSTLALIYLAAISACWSAMYRQFFRMVSNAYRDSKAALAGDLAYVAALICGAIIGVFTAAPAVLTLAFLCVGSVAGGLLNARLLRWRDTSTPHGVAHVWRGIARAGTWTAVGSASHWSFSQGYNYLLVGALDVTAVAAVAATRMLMMPVNLLSTGVGSLMLATVSDWQTKHGANRTLRRVALCALVLGVIALVYLAAMWFARDFIFTRVFHKSFAQRDLMLILWSGVCVLMVIRDQFINFLLVRARYRSLTILTVACAIAALSVTYVMLGQIGAAGAPLGVLTGEIINVAGLIVMSQLEIRRERAASAPG